jgi:hypothetical protein
VAAGAAVALGLLGFLTLRFGGQIAARFFDPPRAAQNDQSSGGRQAGDSVLAGLDAAREVRYGPMLLAGRPFFVRVQRDTGAGKPSAAARYVEILDSTGLAIYSENIFLRRDSTASGEWIEFHPALLEDDAGIPRGIQFTYTWFPRAAGSGVAFQVIAPRGDSLQDLAPTIIGYYGRMASLPAGGSPGSYRLLRGNQVMIESGRGWFDALIPLRIDFSCAPRSSECVRIDLKDSIAGLAKFDVRPQARTRVDTTVALQVFPTPRAATSDSISIVAGQEVDILGGAGRIFFENAPGLFLSSEDEWLEIRVAGRRLWIKGEQSFRAIGLQQGG